MPRSFDYKKEFFERPYLTPENIRFWSILAVVAFVYFSFAISSIRWASNLPSEKIFTEIKKGYQAYLLDLEVENITLSDELLGDADLLFNPDLDVNEQTFPEAQKVTTGKRSRRGGGNTDVLFANIEIEAITSAVKKVPGYTGINPYDSRIERSLSYDNEISLFKSHQDHIRIPIPPTIKFASRNGNRDIYETTAVMEINELDIKFCFEKAAHLDPRFSGHILLSFTIHPDGYVIPPSIKIIQSNINDPRILDCVVKSIRRWRNFKQIAYEDGNFTITRKYIF